MKVRVSGLAMIVGLLSSGVALAQEAEGTEGEGMEATATDEAATEEAPPVEDPAAEGPVEQAVATTSAPASSGKPNSVAGDDGARFRFGISAGTGPMFCCGTTLYYAGLDLRLGAQISDMLAVYAQPQLGGYGGTFNGITGGGGLVGISGLVEVTLIDRIFIGAGGGYGILNSPAGPELHFRLGGYPVMSASDEKIRRKGLMLGADIRLHFLDGATVFAPTVNIGYEAF